MQDSGDRILLLGLGNDILRDDAIGLRVVREVRCRLDGAARVEVRETEEMGLALLDFMAGYSDVVIVDAVQTRQAAPGFVHEVSGSDLKSLPATAPHFLGVGETLALGRTLGLAMPRRVEILAVEVEDPFTLGTQMTPALQAAFPQIVERVLAVPGRSVAGGSGAPAPGTARG
jgi:hydrogenase maturation protease